MLKIGYLWIVVQFANKAILQKDAIYQMLFRNVIRFSKGRKIGNKYKGSKYIWEWEDHNIISFSKGVNIFQKRREITNRGAGNILQ